MAEAEDFSVEIKLERFRTEKQQKLLQMLNDDEVRVEVNTRIKDAINVFVPKKSGALRASANVYPDRITWGEGLKYARYQYGGEVYGPNLPGVIGGTPAWKSKRGVKKHPTGRELGKIGTARLRPVWGEGVTELPTSMLYKFGYTTRGTHHHWDQYFRYFPKMKANLEITRYLKKECKKRGLKK